MGEYETVTLTPTKGGITQACTLLSNGDLVSFPTETVYGLGADARNDRAVAKIFSAKGRPQFNPLIVHVASTEAAHMYGEFNPWADRLASVFWPGPMTLVLPVRSDSGLAPMVMAGLPTVALRVPEHPVARRIITAFDGPIAAPSANPSGRTSPTTAQHVLDGLSGRIAAVVDGGPCPVGLESTIVAFDPDPILLRPGGVPTEIIERALGVPLKTPILDGSPTAPGQLASHYAPLGRVRLNAKSADQGETHLGFGSIQGDINLSVSGDLVEAAANLFGALHELDRQKAMEIAVAPIPERGLGRAINDRLRRAAAPRNAP